jgi:23S rRNA pseudouridine1911/1915/1917 synthase
MSSTRSFEVATEEAHERLDVVLARHLELSRAQTRRLLESGCVRLDGAPVGRSVKGLAVAAGSRVEVEDFVHPRDARPRAEPDAPLAILAEGTGWLAVDKPAGVPVHPYTPEEGGTLLNALVARHPEMIGVGEGALRSGVLHRLDVDTSGALLFGTEETAWQRLREAFAEHRVAKTYRAIVAGVPEPEGRLDLRLVVAQHQPAFVKVAPGGGGKATRMRWRTLERFADAALLAIELETGFLHQIRAGFAHAGHAVLGDAVYGSGAVAEAAPRQMLHCARLAFEEIVAESPDPADLSAKLAALRGGA